MKFIVYVCFKVLIIAVPVLCCLRSLTKRCVRKKIIPLSLSPLEKYKKEYKANLQRWGQPTPSLPLNKGLGGTDTPKCAVCGRRSVDENIHNIIQGDKAPDKFYPWQVFVRGVNKGCGGVLIAPQWILTAAHCINRTVYILLGTSNLKNHSSSTVIRMSEKEIIHEKFRSVHNDIALIKLNVPVTYNSNIKPICLPIENADYRTSHECYLTGWGYTSRDSKRMSTHLQEIKVEIMSHSECFVRWMTAGKIITSGHLCTELDLAAPNGGACFGDSGGPLSCRVGDSFYLAGIASTVQSKCRKTMLPDLFIRVSSYRDWIMRTILEYT